MHTSWIGLDQLWIIQRSTAVTHLTTQHRVTVDECCHTFRLSMCVFKIFSRFPDRYLSLVMRSKACRSFSIKCLSKERRANDDIDSKFE